MNPFADDKWIEEEVKADHDARMRNLRDYFAGQALAGLLASDREGNLSFPEITAYQYADEMLKARDRRPQS